MKPVDSHIKAVGLLSGGLDSTLAARLMIEQGIDVHAINFTSPFCTCTPKNAGCASVIKAVRQLGGITLRRVALGDEYLLMVRNPKHGYGSGINPCIDCRIMKLRKAHDYMRQIGASFLFTGEVLGQRPMSQHENAIKTIDRESGLQGLILRPLSASLFEPTIPEKKGLVDRNELLSISGRSRKLQISLALNKGIIEYPCPAGGCLLTDKNFSERIRDYFMFTDSPSIKDIPLLKTGRHFRLENGDKIIVARNDQECTILKNNYSEDEHLLEPFDFSGPTVLLKGSSFKEAIKKMLYYTKKPVCETNRFYYRYRGTEKTVTLEKIDFFIPFHDKERSP